jgi:hypothetical protein
MNANELTQVFGRLEERFSLYAKFFVRTCGVAAVVATWYGATLWNMHGSIARLEQGQANGTSNIVAALLKRTPTSRNEAAQNLAAAATLLRTSRIGNVKPSQSVPQSVAAESVQAQIRYPDCRGGRIETYRTGVLVEKCTLDLEQGIGADSVFFVNCIIRFKGGPIPIRHMQFRDCIFQFEITGSLEQWNEKSG